VSLRFRLLLAVGAVALTALAIADVVTYQELRSFLYTRIDQSLEQSHMAIEGALGSFPSGRPGGRSPSGGPGPGAPGGPSPGLPSGSSTVSGSVATSATQPASCDGFAGLASNLVHELQPGTFLEVRSASNAILCRSVQPAPLGSVTATAPELPTRITGFRATSADFGTSNVR